MFAVSPFPWLSFGVATTGTVQFTSGPQALRRGQWAPEGVEWGPEHLEEGCQIKCRCERHVPPYFGGICIAYPNVQYRMFNPPPQKKHPFGRQNYPSMKFLIPGYRFFWEGEAGGSGGRGFKAWLAESRHCVLIWTQVSSHFFSLYGPPDQSRGSWVLSPIFQVRPPYGSPFLQDWPPFWTPLVRN